MGCALWQIASAVHPAPLDFTSERAQLDSLWAKSQTLTDVAPGLYFQVRDIKRQIAFRNPVLDFDQVLLVDMPFPQRVGVAARDTASLGIHGGSGIAVARFAGSHSRRRTDWN